MKARRRSCTVSLSGAMYVLLSAAGGRHSVAEEIRRRVAHSFVTHPEQIPDDEAAEFEREMNES